MAKTNKEIIADVKTTLVAAVAEILRKAAENGDLIVNARFDDLTKDFFLIKKDGTEIFVGKVGAKGDAGEDGRFVVDVQLVEDPEQNNDVFLQVELSDGIILQTRNSLSGYHGKSVEAARVNNSDQLIFSLEGGVDLAPIDVYGLTPISVNGAKISVDRRLLFTLTDGNEIDAGLASDLKGRGVVEVYRQAGKLYIKYDDDINNPVDLGVLVGHKKIEMRDGHLIHTDDIDKEVDLGPIQSFTGAAVVDGNLIISTNQPAPNDTIDLGPVQNLRGKDGISITSVDVRDNTIYIEMSDGSSQPPISVTGLKPIHVIGAEFRQVDNELYLELSDGNFIPTGINADFKGEGVEAVAFDPVTGELSIKYEKDAGYTPIGNIPVATDITVEANGDLTVKWSHEQSARVIGTAKFIDLIERDPATGEVTVTYNTGVKDTLGKMISIESIDILGDDLLVTMTGDTQPRTIGSLRGAPGVDGRGITESKINDKGHLIVTYTDGIKEDTGLARATIQNILGTSYNLTWGDGPDFNVRHTGQVIVVVDKDILPNTDLDLNVEDTVRYIGSLTYDAATPVQIISFVKAGPSDSGKGIFKIEPIDNYVYQITLEDSTVFQIDTENQLDMDYIRNELNIPSDIVSAELSAGDLTLVKADGTRIPVGKIQEVVSVDNAYVDTSTGILHVVLTDGRDIPTVSVIADVTIDKVEIDSQTGELVVTMNNGTIFNAGPMATYITKATINSDDKLIITLSDGQTLDAGSVRNPVLGTIHEFVAFEGMQDIPIDHEGFNPVVIVKGITLQDRHLDLTNPSKIRLLTPRNDNDDIKVILFSKGTFRVEHLEGIASALPDCYYGTDIDGNKGFHPLNSKVVGLPKELSVLNDGDTTIYRNHSGLIDVFKNGLLLHEAETGDGTYSLLVNNAGIRFNQPLFKSDKIRIVDYSRPTVDNALFTANKALIVYETYSPGGTFEKGEWRPRDLNKIVSNGIGARVVNNRIILQPGVYRLSGWAACKGVGQNILRLYDQFNQRSLVDSGAQFSSIMGARAYNTPDSKTVITGEFEILLETPILLMHKCGVTCPTYGFGTGDIAGGLTGPKQIDFQHPGRLVELEIWKIG